MNNQPHGPPPGYDRDREIEEQQQQRQRAALQQQEELAQREREHNERQERERQHREQQYQSAPPHQNNTGSIPIHQPVASRLPGAIHSPGGLLANHGGQPPGGPLGAPSGPGNAFGGPLHSDANRAIQHNPQNATSQLQQQQGFAPSLLHHNPISGPGPNPVGFGGPLQQQQQAQQQAQQQQQQQQQEAVSRLQALPFGAPIPQGHQIPGATALGQGGQQPILNDALSYLDQVKVQFADQPDVYNRFLDIMKDFKSQAIDTPGVINRVSELFAGHPNLIQGFNTFLPPGYRIECGAGNDPNTIRVTTPMGTTVQSITGTGRALPDTMIGQGNVGGGYYNSQRPGNWQQQQQQPQHSIESPEGVFSPQNPVGGNLFNHAATQSAAFEAQQAAAAHQQQQRGVSQLTNAVATLGHPPRNTQTPTPGGQPGMNGGAQPGLEKRGPVEFNHAISYVNKIKNRFQDRPEIYKQFLEILQTYQRESKPIQDVYQQVTHLFNTAPDLLEDFKQFLPESAAQAKAAAAAKAAEEAQLNQTPQPNRSEAKMPPVGNFAPPASTSKESKKRPRNNAPAASSSHQVVGESSRSAALGVPTNKRTKLAHAKSNAPDASDVAPSLTPNQPAPLAPAEVQAGFGIEHHAYFERVKKFLAKKETIADWWKTLNLFAVDIISKKDLVFRVSNLIGANTDLLDQFKRMVEYEDVDDIIENKPVGPSGKVALSNCRGLGPSYRLLPTREKSKPCSGRDEMCEQVLNDDWASHPTWASEDSGFVAHRKNVYEESMHRIEEERHDYDYNIETCTKVVQLLEPIAQSLGVMSPEELRNFRMPLNAVGQSQAIYARVLKKIYGEYGLKVLADMWIDPSAVVPIVLCRLKLKSEEWRFVQREWQKVWDSQMMNCYLRSLDHQGIHVKAMDKKNMSAKHVIDGIKTKFEQQKRQRALTGNKGAKHPRAQYTHHFDDRGVILDVLRIIVLYATNASQHNNLERRRIVDFFEKFIPTFFGLSDEEVTRALRDVDRGSPDDDSEDVAPTELPNGRGKRATNGKKTDLRRGVLDKGRNGTKGRTSNEDSTPGSKESTPDADSIADDEVVDATEDILATATTDRWAAPLAASRDGVVDDAIWGDQPFKRDTYRLFANQTILVFFTIFQSFYRRLKELKDSEEDAQEQGRRARVHKPAHDLGLLTMPEDDDWAPGETYYSRVLQLVDDYINGEIEETPFQAWLRSHYLPKGWQIYTVVDLCKALCKLGAVCSSTDSKEKTGALLSQFYRNRQAEETSHAEEISMRKQADKYVKDAELFVIQWSPRINEATLKWIHKDEPTFDNDDLDREAQWRNYQTDFIGIEPTEGVNREKMMKTLVERNLKWTLGGLYDGGGVRAPLAYKEELNLRLEVNTLKIMYGKPPGDEYFIYSDTPMGVNPETGVSRTAERLKEKTEIRNNRFRQKFEANNAWMKDQDAGHVAQVKADFRSFWNSGSGPGTAPPAPGFGVPLGPPADGDVDMIGAS